MDLSSSMIRSHSTFHQSVSSGHTSLPVRLGACRVRTHRGGAIVASIGNMETTSASKSEAVGRENNLPLRDIPGSYGIPFVSQLLDRWALFYGDGEPQYWQSRMVKYKSTVIRSNMPPGWFWTDSRCIMLLDQKSFSAVFDYDKVDKYKAFAGTIMPSTDYNGGYEVCAYLDASDKKHEQLKGYCFELLKLSSSKWASEFHTYITEAFNQWENKLAQQTPALINATLPEVLFGFLINALTTARFNDSSIPDAEKPVCQELQKWAGFQLLPVIKTGAPIYIEELLHVAPIPASLTKGGYDKMVAFLQKYATETLVIAEKHGLSQEEAVHNLIFFLILNAHGGFCLFLPVVLREVAKDVQLQADLREEVRAAVKASGSDQVTLKTVMNDMPLVASTVFEALRFEPPVPYQYARAKKDFIIESHDARFQVKAGELLGGVNKVVSSDPKVFTDRPNEFNARRFMGPEGEKLLNNLVWSNGRQTDESTVHTKQCAGKEIVPLTGRLLLAELFMRFDSFTVEGVENAVTFTSLTPRSD